MHTPSTLCVKVSSYMCRLCMNMCASVTESVVVGTSAVCTCEHVWHHRVCRDRVCICACEHAHARTNAECPFRSRVSSVHVRVPEGSFGVCVRKCHVWAWLWVCPGEACGWPLTAQERRSQTSSEHTAASGRGGQCLRQNQLLLQGGSDWVASEPPPHPESNH